MDTHAGRGGVPSVELQAHVGVWRPAFPGFDEGAPCPPHRCLPFVGNLGLSRMVGARAQPTLGAFVRRANEHVGR
jgi:hypothetical protein